MGVPSSKRPASCLKITVQYLGLPLSAHALRFAFSVDPSAQQKQKRSDESSDKELIKVTWKPTWKPTKEK